METLPSGPVQVCIGKIAAKCPRCGMTQFERAFDTPGMYSDVLICAGCRAATPYTALLAQISDEATRQANDVLEAARALRKRTE